jgi:hypothetical protein
MDILFEKFSIEAEVADSIHSCPCSDWAAAIL